MKPNSGINRVDHNLRPQSIFFTPQVKIVYKGSNSLNTSNLLPGNQYQMKRIYRDLLDDFICKNKK